MEPINILLIEDNILDAELVVAYLKKAGILFKWVRVETEKEYLDQLRSDIDLIIADNHLPRFNASQALSLLKHSGFDIPFVVVSGSISEEDAVDMMKRGAADYLLKDRLTRLAPAVINTIQQRNERKERHAAEEALRESEEKFRRLAENAQDIIYRYRLLPNPFFEYVSPAITEIIGYTPYDFYADPLLLQKIVSPENQQQLFDSDLREIIRHPFIVRTLRKDGKTCMLEQRIVPIMDETGKIIALEGIVRDVTEQILHQRELETIVSVSTALRNTETRVEIITVVLDQLIQLLQTDGASISLLDPNSGELSIEVGRGVMKSIEGMRIPAGKGAAGYVVQNRQIYYTSNYTFDPNIYQPALIAGINSLAGVPLISQDVVIGTLFIARKKEIDASELRLLVAVADLAASSIRRATLHEQTVSHAHTMAVISETGRSLAETLDQNTIFSRLDQSIHELFPDICRLRISSNDAAKQQFIDRYANFNGKIIPQAEISQGSLKPLTKKDLEELVSNRKTIIHQIHRESNDIPGEISGEQPENQWTAQSKILVPMLAHDEMIGVLQVECDTPDRFAAEDVEALVMVANTAAITLENARLFTELQKTNLNLIEAYDSTLEGWSRALDLRDHETEGHTLRVAELTIKFAKKMGINNKALRDLQRGSLLHDIGKMGIPDQVLLKPGPLTEEEWKIMAKHPDYAYQLLSPIEYLRSALEIPYCHHEKWDGTGYPRGLKGENIPLSARIFALVDVWDALCSDRSYRKAWDPKSARDYIQSHRGTHFDPDLVPVFLNLIGDD